MKIEEHDEQTLWRCPMLGGPVPFRHCRKTNGGFPCQNVVNCWGNRIDVTVFLRENYSIEELEQVFGTPRKSRIETIFETLEDNLGD